jgi:hypothetical protein
MEFEECFLKPRPHQHKTGLSIMPVMTRQFFLFKTKLIKVFLANNNSPLAAFKSGEV